MVMVPEAKYVQDSLSVDYTPTGVRTAGQVVQLPDGKAGICIDAILANALGAARVAGIVEMRQKAEIIPAGVVVGWDEDGDPYNGTGGTGALTQFLADADFIVGVVTVTTTATTENAKVDLNEIGQSRPVTYTTKLTAAQMMLLEGTAVTLVPAPGADKVIQPISIMAIIDYGSEVLAEPSAPDDLEIVYNAAGGASIADIIGDFVILSADSLIVPLVKALAGVAVTGLVNKAIVLDNTGSNYTGNATGDTVFYFYVTVVINKCPLA